MKVTCVLASGGTSDRCTRLLIEEMYPNLAIEFQPDDGIDLSNPPGPIVNSIRNAIDQFDPNLIQVHRDSDNTDLAKRKQEIDAAIRHLPPLNAVQVIPVKKTEAWLLADRTRIGQELKDLKSLRKLSSFQAFEKDFKNALNTLTA